MPELFQGVEGIECIEEIYATMKYNCPNPCTTSRRLWQLRQKCKICDRNESFEKMLEKAVAIMANQGQMQGWFNQCPTASGITDATEDRRSSASKGKGRNVDLVYWSDSSARLRLVELKWNEQRNDPYSAVWQIVGYGIAYIFCRIHKDKLPLRGNSLMNASHVALEVVAPRQYYIGHDDSSHIVRVGDSLEEFARTQIGGHFSMSLNAFSFPEEFMQAFEHDFRSGKDVKEKCHTKQLSDEGRRVRDAFARLALAWPEVAGQCER